MVLYYNQNVLIDDPSMNQRMSINFIIKMRRKFNMKFEKKKIHKRMLHDKLLAQKLFIVL